MRLLTTTLVLSMSFSALANNLNTQIENKIEKLKVMKDSGQTRILDRADKQTVVSYLHAALEIVEANRDRRDRRMERRSERRTETRSNRGSRRGEWSRHASYARNTVAAFTGNYCYSSNKILDITPRDKCSHLTLFSTQALRSISINGKCIDIPNTTFGAKCEDLVDLANSQKPRTNDLEVFTGNYCYSSNKLATIDPGTNCGPVGKILDGLNVRSVKLGDKCVDIPNTTFSVNKCIDYQDAVYATYENDGSRRERGSVELYSGNYCYSSNRVKTIGRRTDCSAMNKIFDGQMIRSVKFRGKCIDIPNTNFLNACQEHSRN